MGTIEIDGKQYEVIGTAKDGLPIIRGEATSVQDGVDDNGNPKISTKINVPAVVIGLTPGKIGE